MDTTITVYWRPGCMFSSWLLRDLERLEVPHERRNIWEDADAAAAVRVVTGGDETVPTVRIGPEHLVNPTVEAVLTTVHRLDPDSTYPQPPEPGRAVRFMMRLLGGS
jgi:glutaredoxin